MGECLLSSRNLNINTGLSNLVQVNIICPKPTNVQNYNNGIIEVVDRYGYTTARQYSIGNDATSLTIFIDISTYRSWTFKRYNGTGYVAAATIELENMEEGNVYTVDFVSKESDNDGYIFGIEIDMNSENPDLACRYLHHATDFSPLNFELLNGRPNINYGSWNSNLIAEALGVRPCYMSREEDHTVTYLDFYNNDLIADSRTSTSAHNGFTAVYDESSATLSRTINVDVMVEFKPRWYKFSIDNNILTFKVATYKVADDWVQDAFLSLDGNGNIKNMYYGMYEGVVDIVDMGQSKYDLRSIIPNTSNIPGSNDMAFVLHYIQSNLPDGYGLADWNRRCYILGLMMLVTKCRNIQFATVDGNNNFNKMAPIGSLYDKGMFAFNTNNNAIKIFGIENFWGNYPEFCDKIYSNISDDITELYLAKYGSVKIGTNNVTGGPELNNESINFETTEVTDNIPLDEKLYISRLSVNESGSCIIPEFVQADPSVSFGDAIYIDSNHVSGYAIVGMHKDNTVQDIGPLSLYFGKNLWTFTGSQIVEDKITYRLIYCN